MYNELVAKEKKLAVIGLGYVGLPIALMFAKKISVIGFDINSHRVGLMRQHIDPSNELPASAFDGADIEFTDDPQRLRDAHFFIVGVPTPIDQHKNPDLRPVLSASRTIAKALKPGDYVVYESTVYPGCTEEDCVPLLEEGSGLKFGVDFKVGYSPERINPGDHNHTVENTMKIVSGCDAESLEEIAKVYGLVIKAGLHKAPTLKVAEAAKVIENTQRDLNIALMNELSMIFNLMGIDTHDVLEAAGTKWNFHKYYPGLVGGHCIGVDPYYLVHKASELGYHTKVILSGRQINDSMGFHIGRTVAKRLSAAGKSLKDSHVLVLGATFKENVSDIRNSKVADVVAEMKEFSINVHWLDPHADNAEVVHEYGHPLITNEQLRDDYDAVVACVSHDEFKDFDEDYFKKLCSKKALIVDVKGMYRGRIKELNYLSL
jgi:UDP-N-acetyl-D-galactosamine dehydrogenase